MTKRLEACRKWNERIQVGELGVAKIYFAEEKLFRLGAFPGWNRNFVVYANRETEKSQAPDDLIPREEGRRKGEVSATVSLGLCRREKGRCTSHQKERGLTPTEYLGAVKNICDPDFHQYYGIPPDFIFRQDGPGSPTSNMAQDCYRRKSPQCWARGERPLNSPDLKPHVLLILGISPSFSSQ